MPVFPNSHIDLPEIQLDSIPSLAPILKAIEADSSDPTAYRSLFLALRKRLAQGQPNSSEAFLQTARFLKSRLALFPDDPLVRFACGLLAKLTGDYSKAVEHMETGIQNGARFWKIFAELIPYYRSKQELLQAIDLLQERISQDPSNSFLHQGLGFIHFWLDNYGLSRRHLDLALELQEKTGDHKAQTDCLYNQAYLSMYLNQYDRADQEIRRSIHIAQKITDLPGKVRGMELLSFIMIDKGDYHSALELCLSAYALARQQGDPDLEAMCHRTLGVAYMETGDLAAAQDYLDRAGAWYKQIGEDRLLGILHYWKSLLFKHLGDFPQALEIAQQGLEISQREGFRTAEAFHLSAIGDFYYSLGLYDKALTYNKKALLISQNYIGKWSRGECLNSIGAVYLETARYREALEYFKVALNYIRQIYHIREEARCLYNIGLAYSKLEDFDRALDYFRRSRREAELSGKKTVLGMALIRLGDLALRREEEKEAEALYRPALTIGDETGHPAIYWQACVGLGALATRQNRILEAADYYQRAVAVIENQRNHIMEHEYSAGFFQSKLEVYENLVNLYFGLHVINPDQGYDRECFFYAEKAKSRAFLDDLKASRIDPMTFPGSAESRQKIQTLSQNVSRLLTELSRSDLDRTKREGLWDQLERTEEELQVVVEAARRVRPDLAQLMRCEPSRLPEIRSKILKLGTGLIEFLVGEHHLFIFYLTDDRLAVHRLGDKETKLTRDLVRNYTLLLASSNMTASDCAAAGRRLYELLILPGKDVITKDIDSLIIIPDREFCMLPFETLSTGTKESADGKTPDYVLYHHAITYAPSASSLVNILARDHDQLRQKDLLAVGDPTYWDKQDHGTGADWDNLLQEYYREKRFEVDPLPFTRREVKAVTRFVQKNRCDIFLGKAATEDTVKSLRLNDYRILHFATHSLLDERVSDRSALVLTQDSDPEEDGFLQVREIYQRELDADLVVLSACRTGLGKLEKGEGIQGLPRAFFCAGASTVLVSLWPVRDRSTARFMELFYYHLSSGKSKQTALRQAKLDMLDSKDIRPSDWAGFILMGEGKQSIMLQRPSFWQRIRSRIF